MVPNDEDGQASLVGSCDEESVSGVPDMESQTVVLPQETCCYIFARKRCCCCSRRRVGRNTKLRKKLEPNINDPEIFLERWQRKFLLNQTLTTLEEYEHKHTANLWWFQFLKRMLKFLTVLLPALVVAEKTPYVQDDSTAVMVMFFVMMALTLQVNYLSGVLTDFAYMKRMVLFSEAQTSLEVMLNNFLTRTQRYGGFKRQSDAFRTFKRDEGALRIMVMQKDNFLHTGSQEQMEQSSNMVVAKRREFSALFDPIDEEEEQTMFEKRSKLLAMRRRKASQKKSETVPVALSEGGVMTGQLPPVVVDVRDSELSEGGSIHSAASILRRRITPPKPAPEAIPEAEPEEAASSEAEVMM